MDQNTEYAQAPIGCLMVVDRAIDKKIVKKLIRNINYMFAGEITFLDIVIAYKPSYVADPFYERVFTNLVNKMPFNTIISVLGDIKSDALPLILETNCQILFKECTKIIVADKVNLKEDLQKSKLYTKKFIDSVSDSLFISGKPLDVIKTKRINASPNQNSMREFLGEELILSEADVAEIVDIIPDITKEQFEDNFRKGVYGSFNKTNLNILKEALTELGEYEKLVVIDKLLKIAKK